MDESDIVQYLRQDSHVIPVSKRYEAAAEIERLRRMLQHIADQDYDAGYSAEDFARHALDPKFDEGDVIPATALGI